MAISTAEFLFTDIPKYSINSLGIDNSILVALR
jgi:hypothetical protein